ncbi:MAG: hypothetical protein WA985_01115 [Erythrobacter sp.]|uniref:hypothetical protein n=1 Tax=Erythrobacter sp. TaxID=1042 RepID=UPI003C7257B1
MAHEQRGPDDEIHIEDDDARAASSPGILRYVLLFSTALAVIAMTLVWIIPALTGAAE